MIRDPYQTYVYNCAVGSNPLQLVIAMYEAAITSTQEAKSCLERGDVCGRARAISKAGRILAELIITLNPEVGSDIGRNLDRLYHYMQRRLQEAHLKQAAGPLTEVDKLLRQLLEAWYKVAAAQERPTVAPGPQMEVGFKDIFSSYSGDLLAVEGCERLAVSA